MQQFYGIRQKPFSQEKPRVILAVLIVINLFVFIALFSKNNLGLTSKKLSPELKIDFVNVGNADCCVVQTPNGRTFVIDGGSNIKVSEAKEQNRELIQNYLKKLNITEIDGVVVSNWYIGNFNGLVPLLNEYKVKTVYETPIGVKNEFYDDFDEVCKKKDIKRISVKSGNVLEWGDEIFVQVLNPEDVYGSEIYSEKANDSIVLLIRYGEVQVLLCSQIQEEAEREVIKYNEGIKSQIIKIPEYASEVSLYKNFFEMVEAKDGIISVGKNNPLGYPSEKALDLFEKLNMKLYRTDLNGNIHLTIGGKNKEDYKITVDRNI